MTLRNLKLTIHITLYSLAFEYLISKGLFLISLNYSFNGFLYAPWIITNIFINYLSLYLTVGRNLEKYNLAFLKKDSPIRLTLKSILELCIGLTWRQFLIGVTILSVSNLLPIFINSVLFGSLVYFISIFSSALWILNKQYGALKIISLEDEESKTIIALKSDYPHL